jgi:hypothetical protein
MPPPVYPPGYLPPPVAYAPPRAEPPVPEKHLGVGFKIGNGLGFTGADIIIAPVNHLAFDLQANVFSVDTGSGTATGHGFAPAVQGRLFADQVSTPYVGVGLVYATVSLDNVTASATGVFANLGYEWRWGSGIGIILGGGVSHVGNIRATDGVTTIDQSGGTHFNLEAGLRFMFL